MLDPDFAVWRAYGNQGWPGRYLFDRRGLLRYIHYGEGDYVDTELAIQELLREIDDELELPAPLEPLRPEDAPGVMLEPQTADIVAASRPRAPRARARLDRRRGLHRGRRTPARPPSFEYTGGAAWAVLSGGGSSPGSTRCGRQRRGGVAGPAAARLAVHASAPPAPS